MTIQKLKCNITTNSYNQRSKIHKIQRENFIHSIDFIVFIAEQSIKIKIEYFFKEGKLYYKTFLEDPDSLLDQNTKKKIETVSNDCFLNKC